jgi:hypothetical protein
LTKISKDDIKYTLSDKGDEYSYHISIPSIISTPKELKQAIETSFNPASIVESAEAYDNASWVNWFFDKTEAGFVKTDQSQCIREVCGLSMAAQTGAKKMLS